MRILITGGAGMIGSHAAELYASKGHEVIVFDNLMRSKLFGYDKKSVEYNWNYLKKYKNIREILGDVRNPVHVKNALSKNTDVIIHTAGQPGVGFSLENPREDYSINAFGTFNVLEHVRKTCPGAIFIYCSTNKVYGENVSKLSLVEKKKRYVFKKIKSISEDFGIDLTSHTPYGASKYVGDIYTQEYASSFGIRAVVLRLSCIYGTRQFGFEDQGWLAHFIISNVMGRPVTIYGNGKQVRDVLYVEDLVRCVDRFIKSGERSGIFNVGGGTANTISLLEFINMIESSTGKKMKIRFDRWRPSDQKVYISDISKVKKQLKWQPEISVKAGIGKVLKWVKKNMNFFT